MAGMLKPGLASLLVALFTVGVTGCSTSTKKGDSAKQSPATTLSSTVSSTSLAPTTVPVPSLSPTTQAPGTTSTSGSTDCTFVAPADVNGAGFVGTVSPGELQSQSDDGDRSSITCSFGISTTNASSNVLITYAPKGGTDVFESRLDTFADVTVPIDDLGDRAEYSARKSSETMSSLERGYSDLQVVVLKGQAVLEVSAPSALMASQDKLVALVRIAVDRIA